MKKKLFSFVSGALLAGAGICIFEKHKDNKINNAVKEAEECAQNKAFSKEILITALESYDFSHKDASKIAEKANIDWFAQAEKKAKQCMEIDKDLKFETLVEILEYCHAFTHDEAVYGAETVLGEKTEA